MQRHQRRRNEQSWNHVQPDAGEDERRHGEGSERGKNEAVVERAVEHDHRAVTEEIEKEPHGEHGDEHDEWNGLPEEAEEQDEERDQGVIHTEVSKIALDTKRGFAEGVGEREGAQCKKLIPWTPRGKGGRSGGAWDGRDWIVTGGKGREINRRHWVEVGNPNPKRKAKKKLVLCWGGRFLKKRCFVSFQCNKSYFVIVTKLC